LKPALMQMGAAALLLASLAGCGSTGSAGRSTNAAGLPGQSTELKTASDQTSDEKRASIRLQLAVGYYSEGSYTVALDEVKKSLEAKSDYAEAYGVRALIYTAMGEMLLAEENYQHAMRLAPNNPELSNNYGSFLCQNNRGALGMPYFEAALRNPMYQSPVKAKINAGVCALKMKNYDTAERYLLDAWRSEPDVPTIHANLARIYFIKRDYTRAGYYINRLTTLAKPETLSAPDLWMAIRVQHKLGEQANVTSLGTQLRRRHPASPEFALYQRGAFDE
jgi:type IV pilus assembly protein PilF